MKKYITNQNRKSHVDVTQMAEQLNLMTNAIHLATPQNYNEISIREPLVKI